MPLRARYLNQEVVSVDLPPEAFEALRETAALTMTCCNERAVPKRSSRGLPFFAHARRHECPVAPESEFHLQAKLLIAQAVRDAGWQAAVEVPGLTPDGTGWRADVLATDGRSRIAFEVQRSSQTLKEIRERQLKYARSGIRGMWFLQGHAATLRQPQHWLYRIPMFTLRSDFHLPAFDLQLDHFIPLVLHRHLRYFPQGGDLADVLLLSQTASGGAGRLEAVVLRPAGQPGPIDLLKTCPAALPPWLDQLLSSQEDLRQALALPQPLPAEHPSGGSWRRLSPRMIPLVLERFPPGTAGTLRTVLLSAAVRAAQVIDVPLPPDLHRPGRWWISLQ